MTLDVIPNVLFINRNIAASGRVSIVYEKRFDEELFERVLPGGWQGVDLEARASGNDVRLEGDFTVDLDPGDVYEVGLFPRGRTPADQEPSALLERRVHALLVTPSDNLLIESGLAVGGTWLAFQGQIANPGYVALAAVTRAPPPTDLNGFPVITPNELLGTFKLRKTASTGHVVEVEDLLPGQSYVGTFVVSDRAGRWQMYQETVRLLRRRFSVELVHVTVVNDGDPFAPSDFQCSAEVFHRDVDGPNGLIASFFEPGRGREWAESGQTYPFLLDHTYQSPLERVTEETKLVAVRVFGKEFDGDLEPDELASSWRLGERLPFPIGRGKEKASGTIDIDTVVRSDDFHFSVRAEWRVAYAR